MQFLVIAFSDRPGQSCTEAMQRWYRICADSAVSTLESYGACAASVRRPLCNSVVLGIRVPKVYNFTFLLVLSVEMPPETKGRKGKRSKKENVDPSQVGHTVRVRSPWDSRMITALYKCNFRCTAWAPCGNLVIAAQGVYDYPKSLQSSYDFFF